MALSHDEIQALKKEFFDEADERYVHINVCNDKQSEVNRQFSANDTRIKLFEQKIKSWEWMFKLIATGTVGTLVTSVLSLILK